MARPFSLLPGKGPANGHPRRILPYDVTISGNLSNFNLAAALGSRVVARRYRVLVATGTLLGSAATSLAAFDTGALPMGASVELVVKGRIQGAGGAGGNGSAVNVGNSPGAGSAGGDAVAARCPMVIRNYGMIGGGGGGGGGGARGGTTNGSSGGGGGGGAGAVGGKGGWVNSGLQTCGGNAGFEGGLDVGGNAGAGCDWNGGDRSGNGGAGGAPGMPGMAGGTAGGGSGAAGGAAGRAVNRNGYLVSVVGTGAFLGGMT